MKSDELIEALSNPFIPPSAPLLFPRRVKRVKKAVDAYLEKFRPPSLGTLSVGGRLHRGTQQLPRNIMVPVDNDNSSSSNTAFIVDRDAVAKDLKRDMDEMLDVMCGSTEALPETIASVSAVFSRIKELGGDIRTNKQRRKSTPTRNGGIQDAMYLD